jgi:hypothetical protein
LPHLSLVRVDGEALGAAELEHADPPNGTLIEHEDALLRVDGRVDRDVDDPEQLAVLVVETVG